MKRVPKGHINNVFGTAYRIKGKLPGHLITGNPAINTTSTNTNTVTAITTIP